MDPFSGAILLTASDGRMLALRLQEINGWGLPEHDARQAMNRALQQKGGPDERA